MENATTFCRNPNHFNFSFIELLVMPTMQNAKCKVQNEGVAFGDLFQLVPKEHLTFAFVIYHFAFPAPAR